MAGLGSSEARTTVNLEKLLFAPGEVAVVRIDHDNSQCKKAVKSFKIKLLRRISCMAGKKVVGKPALQVEEYLSQIKYPGCPEKQVEQRAISFELPNIDKTTGSADVLHPDIRHMVKLFTDSADNTLFKIEYVLQVFVKHQSKLEFGMGNFVEFPIQVKSREQNLPFMSTKEQLWYESQEIADWQPQYVYPRVDISFYAGAGEGEYSAHVVQSEGSNMVQQQEATYAAQDYQQQDYQQQQQQEYQQDYQQEQQ